MKLQTLQFYINSKTIKLQRVKSVIIMSKMVSQFFDVRCNSCGNPGSPLPLHFTWCACTPPVFSVNAHGDRSSQCRASSGRLCSSVSLLCIISFCEVHVINAVRRLLLLFTCVSSCVRSFVLLLWQRLHQLLNGMWVKLWLSTSCLLATR